MQMPNRDLFIIQRETSRDLRGIIFASYLVTHSANLTSTRRLICSTVQPASHALAATSIITLFPLFARIFSFFHLDLGVIYY